MRVDEFQFELPEAQIARHPLPERSASRLLHVRRAGGWQDRQFADLPGQLRPGDLLVRNNTRVIPARLYGRRVAASGQPGGGRIEVLLTRQLSADASEWQCLVRPGKKIQLGTQLHFGEDLPAARQLSAEVIARGEFGERSLRFLPVPDFWERLEAIGHVPLPPYMSREDEPGDRERYQTVYARERGSAAAPTAGLHFTPQVLAALAERGVEAAEITLHVGLGTFQPVKVEIVEEHRLHAEPYTISPEAAEAINRALAAGRRIVAVGTTTVRTLEHAVRITGPDDPAPRIAAGSGETSLFIYPGFRFRAVGAILTNFHLPESTLLMLVCAFAGQANVLAAYRHAVSAAYRFFSYGDCMLLEE